MNKITNRRPLTLVALAVFGSLLPAACLYGSDYITLSISDQIAGGTTTSGSFLWESNGKLISSDQPLSNGLPAQGSNALLWNSATNSFQVSRWWSASDVGFNSAAFGYISSAPNECSFAAGFFAQAYGFGSMAFGQSSSTFGDGAVALGSSWAVGTYAAAVGGAYAQGDASFATGYGTALNSFSMAGGTGTASGDYAVAFGNSTFANAFACLAIGQVNLGLVSPTGATEWVPTDPLFEIGNGQPGTAANNWEPIPSNALTVYKNGNATFQGVVHVAPGGDIPMFQP